MIWPLNKLFKRNQAVADAWVTKMGMPIYTNWTIQKAVKDGYRVNGWVYRSVYLIAKAISQVGWVVADKDGAHLENHHLSKTMRKPNPHISRQDMMELVSAWLELGGNSYLKKVKAGGRTVELWPVSPDRLAPIPSKQIDEWLMGYALDQKNSVAFTPEEIIHHKFFNPANPLLGIAPLEAAARAVDVDNDIQDWNKSAMQNRAVVDGIMSFDRNFDSQEDVDAIRDKLNEGMAGKENARRIKVVGSNAKYTRMGLNPAEMDFNNSRKFNREEIFIVFGIPPVYAGVTDAATMNNYKVSELIFWFQTVIPLLDDIKDTFNRSFGDELSEKEEIIYDMSKVRAIREAMLEWTKTAKELHEMGVPFDQLNKVFEFGFDEFEGWDQSHVKVNNANIAVDDQAQRSTPQYALIERRATESEQDKIAKQAEGPVKDIFLNLLEKQQDAIFKDLTEKNLLKVIADSRAPWETELEKLYLDIGGDFGSNMVVEQRKITPALNQALIDFIDSEGTILTEVSLIAETTVNTVLLQIQNGVEQGLSMGDIQQAILDTGVFSPERSLMLARTLTGSAANLGQITSAQLSGATHKTWLTAGFEVRDSHKKMDGKKIKIDELFSVGGHKARYPLDNQLPPAEKCNCFLPGTEIYGRVSKGMRSFYKGNAVEIKINNGAKLRVTENHPILTDHGIIPAGFIQNGYKLITNKVDIKRPVFNSGSLSIKPSYKNNSPILVENIFSTLSLVGRPEHRRACPIDFHGDGAFLKGDIDIVRTDRVLLENIKPFASESGGKVVLKKMFSGLVNESVDGSFLLGFSGCFAPTGSIPCCTELPPDLPVIFFDFIPLEFFGFTSGPCGDVSLFDNSIDRLSRDIVHLSKFFDTDTAKILLNYFMSFGFNVRVSAIETLPAFCPERNASFMKNLIETIGIDSMGLSNVRNRLSGDVTVDDVLGVKHFDYSGYVYDVESPNGWVFANGILASNCRCTLTYSLED